MLELSLNDMKVVVKRAFNMTQYAANHRALEGEAETVALQATLDKHSTAVPPISVHVECTLLIYHHHEAKEQHLNAAFTPPFQYIAVNNLSCFCYWNIYKEYSKTTNRIFSFRGSYSKLDSPWWAPTGYFEGSMAVALRRGLYSGLVELYSEHLKQLRDCHGRLSDSTVASNGSGSDERITADDNGGRKGDKIIAMHKAKMKVQGWGNWGNLW